MNSTLNYLKNFLSQSVNAAGFSTDDIKLELSPTKTLDHGHFATNIALILAKKVGKNPREVAQLIANEALKNDLFEKVEVAGPGFINLFIEQNFYSKFCQSIIQNLEDYLKNELSISGAQTMVIDYSHPNIAKPMGVHHLLSTIIGDSLCKIYRKLGYAVVADNFIGDLGTQFGKLIHAIKTWGDMDEIEKDPINALLKLYVQFHFAADEDIKLDDEGRREYQKFEEGDEENRALWKKIVKWSLMEIQPVYDRLGVKFDHINGESFYEDKMPAILKDGRERGVFVDGKDGAWIVPADDPNDAPAVIQKSDGTTLYVTRDLARTKYWNDEFKPDLMVIVADVAQEFHFRKLFEVVYKLDLTEAKNVHVSFGRMQFKDGKMSTRKGNIIRLTEVLDEAESRSAELINEKGADLSNAEKKELARIMGVGSVKYNILHQNRIQNMTFEWDKMLSFEGNSAPYLMYTVARAKSLLRKADVNLSGVGDYKLLLEEGVEMELVLTLTKYAEVLKRSQEEFKPNHIANYLYQLAQDFNRFYNAVSILKADDAPKKSRLLLSACVIKIMEDGMGLLGIETPERM